ncbi:hypothetical protein [Scale drop disease virus]|uniref:ORF_059R n=1 Tax=Scale drop disease virus TaxID=1697349 RepID=A0A0K1L6H7_9VIRU|nr:ORF_059R [Scale drop disease virus]AKU37474.1 ORF_059R [Scale drop disease virus]QLI60729.1 hypothetical protein [Scale drop disease virus]QXJ13647.1 ORF059R [Scale drop disease virus]UNH60727.1 hypothetical protein SDDV_ORF058 [Scale drop disease virus]
MASVNQEITHAIEMYDYLRNDVVQYYNYNHDFSQCRTDECWGQYACRVADATEHGRVLLKYTYTFALNTCFNCTCVEQANVIKQYVIESVRQSDHVLFKKCIGTLEGLACLEKTYYNWLIVNNASTEIARLFIAAKHGTSIIVDVYNEYAEYYDGLKRVNFHRLYKDRLLDIACYTPFLTALKQQIEI